MLAVLPERRIHNVRTQLVKPKVPCLFSVGRPEAEKRPDIPLSGEQILEFHCRFANEDGTVTLIPEPGAQCYVNGQPFTSPTKLTTGSRVILGRHHVFRYQDPLEAKQSRYNLAAAASKPFPHGRIIPTSIQKSRSIGSMLKWSSTRTRVST